MRKLRVATVFSGIGSFEHAMNKLNIDHDIVFACDNGEIEIKETKEEIEEFINENKLNSAEIKTYIEKLYKYTGKENFVEKTYKANYKIDDKDFYQDIRFLNGNEYKGKVDIFVGGSPCQSFSISGKRKGLEDTRGTLFYEYARLVKEVEPYVFIYENVPGMLNHDGGNTWKIISSVFDDLGYEWELYKLNATSFGIPQNRSRIFVVGIKKELNISPKLELKEIELKTKLKDYLDKNVDEKYYHGEKGFKWITKPLSLKKRVSINGEIARTQAANQQFNWCGDMVFEEIGERNFSQNVYIGEYNGKTGVARKLTPRECLRLMGYDDSFKIVVPDNKMYRQSGNSIVVNVLEAIIQGIIDTKVFDKSIKVGTLFSGIGSFEWALKRLGIAHEIVFACDNGDVDLNDNVDYNFLLNEMKQAPSIEEMKNKELELYSKIRKENYVEKSYKANFKISKENYHYNICLLDGQKYKNSVDILVGGSPCQSFSIMGYQKGLEDARGTLFYEYARLVKEIEPKVFIYENVQGLLKHDKGNTWNIISNIFDSLGYYYTFKVLNSKNFGIPQNRNRLFVIGFKDKEYLNNFEFPNEIKLKYTMQDFLIENCADGYFKYDKIEKIPGIVDEKYFLSEKVKKHVMSVGTKNYVVQPKTDLTIARPLLATMHKMHRAGVDNYITINGKLRRLTPRECLRLMGFGDEFKQVVSDTQMYKQAGNSIVSDIFVNLIPQIIKTKVFE